MGKKLYNKDGDPIEYTKDSYNPITQQNEPELEFDIPTSIPKGTMINIGTSFMEDIYTGIKDLPGTAFSEADVDEDYDYYGPLGSWEATQKNRVSRQSDFARGSRAVFGGLLKGVGTALKDIGYMLDWNTYAKTLGLVDMEQQGYLNSSLNWVGDMIHEGADKYMPIYEDPNPKSISDQLMKWSTVSSILDSALGFAIPGSLAVKGGSLAVKGVSVTGKLARWLGRIRNLTRVEKLGNRLARTDAWFTYFQKANPTLSNIMNVAAPTLMSGYGEAMWEATEAHDEFIHKLSPTLFNNENNLKDIVNLANTQAEQVFRLNLAKSVLNLHIFNSMATKFSKGIIKKPTIAKKLMSVTTEVPLEALEESSQDVFRKEAEFSALKTYENIYKNSPIIKDLRKTGQYPDDLSDSFTKRLAELYSTNDAIVSGIIGGIAGPVQHLMTRGVGARKRFKDEVREYEAQQEFLKEKGKLLQSEEAFMQHVEKAALSDNLVDLADKMDDDRLREFVKKQLYTQEIVEHHSKGLLPYLEGIATKHASSDGHMSDMYKYIKEVQPLLKKSNKYLNKEEVFNKSVSLLMTEELKKSYEDMRRKIMLRPENERTEPEKLKLNQLNKAIAKIDENIVIAREELNSVTSGSYQRKLMKAEILERELVDTVNAINNAVSISEVNEIVSQYPGLKYSKTYADKVKSLSNGPKKHKKVKASNQNIKTKSVDSRDIEKTNDTKKKKKSKKTKGLTEYEEGKGRTVNKAGQKLNQYNIVVASKQAIKGRVMLALDNITDKATQDDLEAIADIVYEEYDKIADGIQSAKDSNTRIETLVHSTMNTYLKDNRPDVVKDIRSETKDAGIEQRKLNAFGDPNSTEKLPEENLVQLATLASEAEKIEETLVDIPVDNTDSEEDVRNKADRENLTKELSRYSGNLMPKALQELKSSFHLDKELNPEGLPVEELFPDFKSFLSFVVESMGEEFAHLNYNLLGSAYNNITGRVEKLPETYAAAVETENDTLIPDDMPTVEKNQVVFDSKAKATPDKDFATVIDESDITQRTFNKDATSSMAHLSRSYHIETDDEGKPLYVDDTTPTEDLSVILNPEKYNGGEGLTFQILLNYKGKIVPGGTGSPPIPFQTIKTDLIDRNGNVRAKDDKVFQKFVKELGLPADSTPEDFIPISILGPKGEHLAYMHQPNWFNKMNTEPGIIEQHKDTMRSKRSVVINTIKNGKEATGKVSGKVMYADKYGIYRGFLMNYAKTMTSADEALKDNVDLGILTSSTTMLGFVSPNQILNFSTISELPLGITFAIVPIGIRDGKPLYHAEPLFNTPLSGELNTTAMSLITAYLTSDIKGDLVKAYKTKKGIDITSPAGIKNALKEFMYLYEEKGVLDLDRKFERTGNNSKNAIISINKEGDITFGLASKTVVNKDKLYSEQKLNMLKNMFADGKFRFNPNSKFLNNNSKRYIVTANEEGKVKSKSVLYNDFVKSNMETDLRSNQLADGSYTYTLQNIVEYSIDGKKPGIADTNKEVAEKAWKDAERKTITIQSSKREGFTIKSPSRIAKFKTIVNNAVANKDTVEGIINELNANGFTVDNISTLKAYLAMRLTDNTVIEFDEFVNNNKPVKIQEPEKEKISESNSAINALIELNINDVTEEKVKPITEETSEIKLSTIFGSIENGKLVKELIDNKDESGINKMVPKMQYYKKANPVENTEFYQKLSEKNKELAIKAYKINTFTLKSIENIFNKGSEGVNSLQHMVDKTSVFNKVSPKNCR